MKRLALLLSLVIATPAFAQQAPAPSADAGVSALRAVWQNMSSNVLKSAEQMPEEDYAFRPVGTVRTFGQQIAHVAGAQYAICAAALGEPGKAEDDIEKRMTKKADLIAALKASNEYCARAYAQSDAALAAMTKLFGGDNTRMFVLALNAAHDAEHYGNLITYLRIKGRVPPSSQGQ